MAGIFNPDSVWYNPDVYGSAGEMPDVGTIGGGGDQEWGDGNDYSGSFGQPGNNGAYNDTNGFDNFYSSSDDNGGDNYGNEGNNYPAGGGSRDFGPGEDWLDKLFKFGKGVGTNMLMSKLGPAAGIAKTGLGMYDKSQQGLGGSATGNLIGSLAGSSLGPLGSLAGGALGNWVGGMFDSPNGNNSIFSSSAPTSTFGGPGSFNTDGSPFGASNGRDFNTSPMDHFISSLTGGLGGSPTGSSGNMGGLLGAGAAGLAGAYMGNRAASAAQGQISNLDNLFSPNSPYAKQMEQTLARKDAAGGRRSQYGTRAVELAADLAKNQAQVQNSANYNSLQQQKLKGRQQGINTLLALSQTKEGKQLLNSLFSGFGGQGSSTNWGFGSGTSPSLPTYGGFGDFSGQDVPDLGGSYDFGG